MKRQNFKEILLFLICFNCFGFASAQELLKGSLTLKSDLNLASQKPWKLVVKRIDLGGYSGNSDTILVKGIALKYKTELTEPCYLSVDFYWKDRKFTTYSFWAMPATYEIGFANNLIPMIKDSVISQVTIGIEHLIAQHIKYAKEAERVVGDVNYENQKIADVETKIWKIRDSFENLIDSNIYLSAVNKNPNSVIGLYALLKFAERPYGKARTINEPKKIDSLLNTLDPTIKALPSARKLFSTINLEAELKVGNAMKDIALPNAVGKIYKISDFRGKYLLVDFWASW
ncbi:MAG: hypothetical protein EOO93_17580, partial [Pedobacter sp.]